MVVHIDDIENDGIDLPCSSHRSTDKDLLVLHHQFIKNGINLHEDTLQGIWKKAQ